MDANELLMDAADLRAQAKQCRDLARAAETSAVAAEQLLRWAQDYEEEAAALIDKTAALARVWGWLRNARSLSEYGCPAGLPAGTQRQKLNIPRSQKETGYSVRSRKSKLTGRRVVH
jgi:hypothetical protein